MSSSTPSLKPHNHLVHSCTSENKKELLNFMLENNSNKDILVVTANHIDSLKSLENKNVKVISDAQLIKLPELKCEMLINYDLPGTAIEYMVRLAHTTTYSIILLDSSEHKQLYPIETLLGRALKQEIIKGFEPEGIPKKEEKPFKKKEQTKEYKPKKEYKPRSDRDSSNSKSDKWQKKDKPASKYIGKDENGKPMFSDKSRERNHRYDGTPKSDSEKVSTRRRTGKKINIKALKPKKETDTE